MASPTILVVEGDAACRRVVKETLEAHGYAVTDVADGAAALESARADPPALLLLRASLSDFLAADLVRRLRATRGMESVPVLGLLGLLARPDEDALAAVGFDDFLVVPVDPARLLEAVATHLAWAGSGRGKPGRGKRVVVADDDPDYLAIAHLRLSLAGFEVETAADGAEALEKIRRSPPDVVASDVLMPRMDGLQLCMAIRKDPALGRLPVVLFSGNYLEKADRRLVTDAGATAFVPRTGDLREMVDKVLECAGARPAPGTAAASAEGVEAQRRDRALHQLERQAALNVSLARETRVLRSELRVLAAVAEALGRSGDLDAALRDAFAAGFGAWGLCPGALYTLGPEGGPVLRARSGYASEAGPALEGFFGHAEIARRAVETRDAVAVRPSGDRRAPEDDFLEAAGARRALVVPLLAGGEAAGVLLLASPREDLDDPAVVRFAKVVAAQLAQAVSLARAVASLRASEERYRAIVENATDAVFLLDVAGEVVECNRRAEEMLGRAAADLRHHRLRDFAAPDAADTGWDSLARAFAGEPVRAESLHLARPDGTSVPVEMSASMARIGSRDLVLVVARDVTWRHTLERRLFQAQKMEAVGQLAGGIAHDFNNLLTVVNGYAEILLGRVSQGANGRHELEEILRAGQRAAGLTSMLLGFSRRQVVRPRVLDLKASMGELEEGLRRLKGPGVALEFRHAADLRPVKIDPAQLDQVLVQLVLNSREALSERGGRILIETSNSEFDEAFVAGNEGARLGPHVQIAVADDGRGMDPETLAHVFEPFFTTKEPGKGSGLGLAAVYGILKQNDGYVRVESRPGAGTTVRLWLPRVEAVTATPSARADRPEAAVARAGTVLVVEDEWAVRGLVRQVLSRAGFSVLEAGEGQEALDVAAKHGKDIDVLLADAVMPGMGGREVAERLRAERPGLKVILMSGYSWDALMADSDGAAEAEFLSKPFAPDELLARIEGLMKATDRGRS